MQKWPNSITAIRHVESAYNAINREEIEGYKEFSSLFDEEYEKLHLRSIVNGQFPSPRLLAMAKELVPVLAAESSDYDTQAAPGAVERQAVPTGQKLQNYIKLPDIIYVSPYKRTRQTLDGLIQGWPELENVKVVEDDRIREQEHGKSTIYTDRKLYFVFNPEYAISYKFSTKYEYKHEGGESLLNVRSRLRHFVSMLIREHGGVPQDLHDYIVDYIDSERFGIGSRVLNLLNVEPNNKPEDVLVVTHHLAIMALRSNLERWTRDEFLENNENNRPPNASVTMYRAEKTHPDRSRQGQKGRVIPVKENLVLY